MTPSPIAITAIVTAYRRIGQTLETLTVLKQCDPPPAEILLHVDGNETACADAVRAAHPDVKVLVSRENVGPGGGRNRLMAAAMHPFVASFDDDSYPIDADFFRRVSVLFTQFPAASLICAPVFHIGETVEPDLPTAEWVADFPGGGCICRRDAFQSTGDYIPLPTAYGMEEVDFAIRLHAAGGRVLKSPWLRVFHDTDLKRHADPRVTASSIANLALLAYLRYPVRLWPLGAMQCLNRIRWLVRHGRWKGILAGIAAIPAIPLRYRQFRRPVPTASVWSYLRLRRGAGTMPIDVESREHILAGPDL